MGWQETEFRRTTKDWKLLPISEVTSAPEVLLLEKISDRLSFCRVVVVRGTWFVVGGIPWLQFRKDKVMLVRS